MKCPLILWRFLKILHKIDSYSCPKCWIFTKFTQIVYLMNTTILLWKWKCQILLQVLLHFCEMLDVIEDYYIWSVVSPPNFHRLCVSYQYTYFDILTSRMWPQVTEGSPIKLWLFNFLNVTSSSNFHILWKIYYLNITVSPCRI